MAGGLREISPVERKEERITNITNGLSKGEQNMDADNVRLASNLKARYVAKQIGTDICIENERAGVTL